MQTNSTAGRTPGSLHPDCSAFALPTVAGRRLRGSNADFERACLVHIERLQNGLGDYDSAMLDTFCEAVRLCREYSDAMAMPNDKLMDAAQTTLELHRERPAAFHAAHGSASVLDVCCGSRMFWFDRKNPSAIFVDKRRERHLAADCSVKNGEREIVIDPDIVADFTDLPFEDNTFAHVIFDPPHIQRNGDTSWLLKKYGVLRGDWREMLRLGFAECFRVLKPEGTLIFKWNEIEVPLREILALTPVQPLYGHRTGKQAKTHWCAFLKPNDQALRPATEDVRTRADAEPQVRSSAVVGGLAEIFERAKGAVTEHCRTGMKPAGRSEMYRDMMHGVLDQLRAHCEKPSNAKVSHEPRAAKTSDSK